MNRIQSFNRAVLTQIALRLPRNRSEARQKYPQTWWCMPRRWAKRKHKGKKLITPSEPNEPATYVFSQLDDSPLRKSWWGYPLRCLLEWICGGLTGHEISKTEWGYGGGKFVDRHCRWCDKVLRVPIAESPPPDDSLRGLVAEMGTDPDTGKPL